MRSLLLASVLLLTGCSKSPTVTQTLQEVPATELVASGDRIVYVGKDNALYGLDSAGKHLWRYSTSSVSTKFPPVVTDKIACVYSGTSLVAVSLADGKKKWAYTLEGGVGPGTAGDSYILAQDNNRLALLAAATGKVVKKVTLGGHPSAGVAPAGLLDYCYCVRLGAPPDPEDRFQTQQVAVMSFLVPSMEEMWVQESENGTGLAVSDDLCVFLKSFKNVNGSTTEIQAWDRKSGRAAWDWSPGLKVAAQASRPILSGDTAFLSFTTGLDAFVVGIKDKELWRTPLPINAAGSVVMTPVVRSRELVFVGEENRLVALDPVTGKKKWSADELEGKVAGSPVVADGTVWVATDKKRLYGVKL